MRVTHQAIADRVGVSRTLVTEALHRRPGARINTETRLEILETARKLGYQPRNLTTHNIGYVLNLEELVLETELTLLADFERDLRQHQYRLTLAATNLERLGELSEVLNPHTADGVIFTRWYDGQIQNLLAPKLPWVLISDEYGVGPEVDLIALDTVQTARNVTEYLLQKGHARLGMIVGQADVKYHDGLIQGARQAMTESVLALPALQLIRPYFIEEISEALQAMMRQPDAPTALIVTTPGQAVTTVYALRNAGYRIPEDVSVVSIVDNNRFRALPPVLTATDAIGPHLAAIAMKRLLEKINDPNSPPQHIRVAGRVIERESVAAPRSS